MLLPPSARPLARLAPAAGAAAPSPPGAATGATTASAAATTSRPGDPVVCKSMEETGTRFSHRVCHTSAEWAQITADAKSSTEDFQRASSLSTPH